MTDSTICLVGRGSRFLSYKNKMGSKISVMFLQNRILPDFTAWTSLYASVLLMFDCHNFASSDNEIMLGIFTSTSVDNDCREEHCC